MKEVCVIVADLQSLAGETPRGTDWVVVREDDPSFSGLVAQGAEVREVENLEAYGRATMYDFGGPL